MISWDQIAAWATSGESETLEFKHSTGQRREATRALCAMLNHRGGRVLFGFEPDGLIAGQQVSDRRWRRSRRKCVRSSRRSSRHRARRRG